MGETEQFQVGDVVRLKSGGPEMTVSDLPGERARTESYRCIWFSGKKMESGYFPGDVLLPADKPEPRGS